MGRNRGICSCEDYVHILVVYKISDTNHRGSGTKCLPRRPSYLPKKGGMGIELSFCVNAVDVVTRDSSCFVHIFSVRSSLTWSDRSAR